MLRVDLPVGVGFPGIVKSGIIYRADLRLREVNRTPGHSLSLLYYVGCLGETVKLTFTMTTILSPRLVKCITRPMR